MDRRLQELERRVAADPLNYDFVLSLSQYCQRTNWTYEGRTLSEWAELAKNQLFNTDPFDFIDIADDPFFSARALSRYRNIGPKIIPLLWENYQSEDPALQWNALTCLGFIGPPSICVFNQILARQPTHPAVMRQVEWYCRGVGEQARNRLFECLQLPNAQISRLIRLLSIFGEKLIPIIDDLEQIIVSLPMPESEADELIDKIEQSVVKSDHKNILQQPYIGDPGVCEGMSREELDWYIWCYKIFPTMENVPVNLDDAFQYEACWHPDQIQVFTDKLYVHFDLYGFSEDRRLDAVDKFQSLGLRVESNSEYGSLDLYLDVLAKDGQSFTNLELAHKIYTFFGTYVDFAGHSMAGLSLLGKDSDGTLIYDLYSDG